jgi:hypothetical protein
MSTPVAPIASVSEVIRSASATMAADKAIDSIVYDLAAFGPVDPAVRFAAVYRRSPKSPVARFWGAYPTEEAANAAVLDRNDVRPVRRGPADEAVDMWRGPGWILPRADAEKAGLIR